MPGGDKMEAVMLMRFFSLFDSLCDEAHAMLLGTLRTCCAMLVLSLALLLHIGGPSPRTYSLYRLAAELESSSAGVFLCGNFAALFLERFHRR